MYIHIHVYIHIYIIDLFTLLDLCVSSLHRDHVNLLCIVPILLGDPRRESNDVEHEKYTLLIYCS